MADFLLELRCEEIPARMQAKASADLERLFIEALAQAGLKPASITSMVTPRRLALIAHDLPEATQPVREERKGPRADAPDKAIEGFLRSTGLTRDQLEERADAKGHRILFAVTDKPGRATPEVLAEAIPQIVRGFPWPKSMRWGAASSSTESLRWVRPLQGILALLDETVVPFDIDGIESGRTTVGHRFHSGGEISIENPAGYAEQLRVAYVIVDPAERAQLIETRATALAQDAGLVLVPDAGLVAENAGLTEWPVPLLGEFDPEFLDVPPEVIQLTLRINQKYFVVRDKAGDLAPTFICVANIEAKDGGEAITAGNGKVLAARLSDARFFWEQDKKVPLAQQAKKLERITFHEKLGTLADKVERVAKLAQWLASEGIVPDCDPELARQAAELCKADLVTEMVGEFPELQGIMGGYYARAEGLPDVVAEAIRDHYKPVGQDDEVPTAPVTVAVSLADKLDTLTAFYCVSERPTGSKDPFALRRAILGVIQLINENDLRPGLITVFSRAAADVALHLELSESDLLNEVLERVERVGGRRASANFIAELDRAETDAVEFATKQSLILRWDVSIRLTEFLADRLKVQQREAGIRHDLIDAVFALGGEDDLIRLLARVKALQNFIDTEEGADLLVGYKRAANILKKEGRGDATDATDDPHAPEPAESALIAALDIAEPQAQMAIEHEDFEAAMVALATLRGPIDRFFEEVTVNDPDPVKRQARLTTLTRIRAAVHKVADFSRIDG